jgi:hypothetical protein
VTERKYEWQEVSRVYMSEINKKTFGDLPSIFENLKKKHGEDARIEMDTYKTGGVTYRGEGYVAAEVHTFFKVMKYLPSQLSQQHAQHREAIYVQQLEASKPKRASSLKETIKKLAKNK